MQRAGRGRGSKGGRGGGGSMPAWGRGGGGSGRRGPPSAGHAVQPIRSGSGGDEQHFNGAQVKQFLAQEFGKVKARIDDPKVADDVKPEVYNAKTESLATGECPNFVDEMRKQYMESHSQATFGNALGDFIRSGSGPK